jgi:hypothetical protein
MKYHIGIFALLVLALLVAALGASTGLGRKNPSRALRSRLLPDSSKHAAIVIPEADFDFKQIEQGTIAEHEFSVGNSGDETLMIESVHASCGCTAAFIDAMRIPPWRQDRVTREISGKLLDENRYQIRKQSSSGKFGTPLV